MNAEDSDLVGSPAGFCDGGDASPDTAADTVDSPTSRDGPSRWPGRLALIALLGLPLLSLVVFWAWLPNQSATVRASTPVVPAMRHVHGLGMNPADRAVYVATHSGVFRIGDDGEPVRVADRYQDTMGFTVAGPDRFLASGHPDLTEESLPTHLGLIESSDAARTWQPLSMAGEADLHALDTGPDLIVAFDATTSQLLRSPDGMDWDVIDIRPVVDVAADPSGNGFLATSPEGQIVSYGIPNVRAGEPIAGAPRIGLVDWPAPGLLVGAGADGQLYRSGDGGRSWIGVGEPLGAPQAIDVAGSTWLVATQEEVLASTNAGRTWRSLVVFTS